MQMLLTYGLHRLEQFAHHYLLPLVVAAYALAAVCPALGLWTKHCVVAESEGMTLALPMLLLAVLLFNASLGSSAGELGSVVRRPLTVLAGVTVNLLIPLAFLIVLRFALLVWDDLEEANCLLFGLAVVASMPVAGSSTAWSQNANGNVALSLGLVLLSTLLSPLTTPLVLDSFSGELNGAALQSMNGQGTGFFLLSFVVIPSAFGLLLRGVLGNVFVSRLRPSLRLLNAMVLLFLCYSNATVALPQVIANPDWDFLALVLVAVSGLCLTAFASGWFLAKVLGVNGQDRRALIFGLGMNNNGTGMVLAASALVSLPWAVVPVIAYNLVQHIVAGGLSRSMAKGGQTVSIESVATR
jgi:bile acid:Na+ symporter, BASS family